MRENTNKFELLALTLGHPVPCVIKRKLSLKQRSTFGIFGASGKSDRKTKTGLRRPKRLLQDDHEVVVMVVLCRK